MIEYRISMCEALGSIPYYQEFKKKTRTFCHFSFDWGSQRGNKGAIKEGLGDGIPASDRSSSSIRGISQFLLEGDGYESDPALRTKTDPTAKYIVMRVQKKFNIGTCSYGFSFHAHHWCPGQEA